MNRCCIASLVASLVALIGTIANAGGPVFYDWRYAELAHGGEAARAIIDHPNVRMMIIPRFRYHTNWDANRRPPGYEQKTYAYTLQGFAEWLADWQEFSGAVRGSGSMGEGLYENAIYPMQDAHPDGFKVNYLDEEGQTKTVIYPGQRRPFYHPDDALPADPSIAAGKEDPGQGVWFNKHGIEELRTFWATFLPILKAELDKRNLCYFAILSNDVEESNSRPMDWWQRVREDPRYATEVVLANEDGSRQWTAKDLIEEYATLGLKEPVTEVPFSHARNSEFRRWWLGRSMEIRGYVLHEGISKPWREVFPGTPLLGNYRNALADNLDYPLVHQNGTWVHNATIHHLDYSTLPLYFTGPPHFAPARVREFHPDLTTDYAVFRELQLKSLEAMQKSSRSVPIIPWITSPDYRKTVVLPDGTQMEETPLGIDECKWLVKRLLEEGIDTFLIWAPSPKALDEGKCDDERFGPGRRWRNADEYFRDYLAMLNELVAAAPQ